MYYTKMTQKFNQIPGLIICWTIWLRTLYRLSTVKPKLSVKMASLKNYPSICIYFCIFLYLSTTWNDMASVHQNQMTIENFTFHFQQLYYYTPLAGSGWNTVMWGSLI